MTCLWQWELAGESSLNSGCCVCCTAALRPTATCCLQEENPNIPCCPPSSTTNLPSNCRGEDVVRQEHGQTGAPSTSCANLLFILFTHPPLHEVLSGLLGDSIGCFFFVCPSRLLSIPSPPTFAGRACALTPGGFAVWFLLVGLSQWEALAPIQGQEERKVEIFLLLLASFVAFL